MKKLFLTLILTLAAVAAGRAADAAAVNQHYTSYHAAGKAVVEMAIAKKVDAAEVAKRVEIMVADALWVVQEYALIKPQGAKLLKVISDNVEAMKKLTFKELEQEWHDLHHFDQGNDTGVDLKAEENEHFTDPIHSLVHPLLVLKAAQNYAAGKGEADLKSMKEEMEEGLEQMEKARVALLKK